MLTMEQYRECTKALNDIIHTTGVLLTAFEKDEAVENAIRNVSSELDFMREMLARVYVSDDQGAICYQGRDVLALKAAQAA